MKTKIYVQGSDFKVTKQLKPNIHMIAFSFYPYLIMTKGFGFYIFNFVNPNNDRGFRIPI